MAAAFPGDFFRMEVQRIISELLTIAIVILSVGVLLYSFVFATAMTASKWLERRAPLDLRITLNDAWWRVTRSYLWVQSKVLGALAAGASPDPEIAEVQERRQFQDSPHDQDRRQYQDRRRFPRFRACYMGSLHSTEQAVPVNLCDILDLSANGARIRPVESLSNARRVTLGLENFGRFPAEIAWRRGDEVGLTFSEDPSRIVHRMRGLIPCPVNLQ